MLKRLFLLALFFVCAPGARAGILVDFTGASGNQWHYDVSLTPGLFLQKAGNGAPGSFFTVYDFKGLQAIDWNPSVGTTSSDWSVVQSLTSTVPSQVDPSIDNQTLPNATVTFVRDQPFDPGATIVKLGTLTLTGWCPALATRRSAAQNARDKRSRLKRGSPAHPHCCSQSLQDARAIRGT